jgi:glucose-1-phosphate thymidylyltransferase
MTTSRAIVLARGLGTRMRSADPSAQLTDAQRRAADAGMKAMMPIAGRPFLDYVLSAVADAGLREIALVVAPDHDAVREYYRRVCPPERVALDFVVQPGPRGTADAVLAAEAWAGDGPFLVLNSDNLYPPSVLAAVAALDEPGLPGFEADDLVRSGNFEPARVRAFAIVEADAAGYLTRIVEKPSDSEAAGAAAGAFVSMNCWRFDRRIFESCRDVPPSARGEVELPNAVGLAASRGVPFRIVPARGPVLDLSQRADAAEVTRRLAGIDPRP